MRTYCPTCGEATRSAAGCSQHGTTWGGCYTADTIPTPPDVRPSAPPEGFDAGWCEGMADAIRLIDAEWYDQHSTQRGDGELLCSELRDRLNAKLAARPSPSGLRPSVAPEGNDVYYATRDKAYRDGFTASQWTAQAKDAGAVPVEFGEAKITAIGTGGQNGDAKPIAGDARPRLPEGFDVRTIEACAKVCDDYRRQLRRNAEDGKFPAEVVDHVVLAPLVCAERIRALVRQQPAHPPSGLRPWLAPEGLDSDERNAIGRIAIDAIIEAERFPGASPVRKAYAVADAIIAAGFRGAAMVVTDAMVEAACIAYNTHRLGDRGTTQTEDMRAAIAAALDAAGKGKA